MCPSYNYRIYYKTQKIQSKRKFTTSVLHNRVPVGWVEPEKHLFRFVEKIMLRHQILIQRHIPKPNNTSVVSVKALGFTYVFVSSGV